MKDFILIAVILLLGVLLIMSKCDKDPEPVGNSEQLEQLTAEREGFLNHIGELNKMVDSLINLKSQIVTSIVYREREIDENIAKDSANSIVEYRRSLQDNQELPDGTEILTYREIGIGSKLMAQVPKLKLQLDLSQDIINLKDETITDHQFIEKGYEQSINLHKLETQKWKMAYDKESSFWNSKELWFGLGVVGTAAIVFLTGLAK